MTEPTPTDYVQSLAGGLMRIRVFDVEHPRQTLSGVAKVTTSRAQRHGGFC